MIWMPLYSVPFQNGSSLFVDRKGGTIEDGLSKLKWRHWVFLPATFCFMIWLKSYLFLLQLYHLGIFVYLFCFGNRTSNIPKWMWVWVFKSENCTIVSVKFYFTAVVLCMMHVSSAASHVPAVQQHPATISALFTVSFPVAPLILWFAVWSGSHLTLSALLSHIPPGCQVLHWQAAMMVSTTAKAGRGWTGNEWTGFNPARGLLNTCVAVSHSWVVNPCGSWKNEDFSFLEVIVGLVSNTSFQFQ